MSEEKKTKLTDEQVEQVSGGRSGHKGIVEDLKEAGESHVEDKFHPVKVSRHIHR